MRYVIHHYVMINKDINAGDKRNKKICLSFRYKTRWTDFKQYLPANPQWLSPVLQAFICQSSLLHYTSLSSSYVFSGWKIKTTFHLFFIQCHKNISCPKDNGEKNNNKMLHLEIKPVCTFGYLKLFLKCFFLNILK